MEIGLGLELHHASYEVIPEAQQAQSGFCTDGKVTLCVQGIVCARHQCGAQRCGRRTTNFIQTPVRFQYPSIRTAIVFIVSETTCCH